jgi:hypothetical protein
MRKLKALFLCWCVVCSLLIVAEAKVQQINKPLQISNSRTKQHNENGLPNIFRPVGNFIRKLFRKKPKFYDSASFHIIRNVVFSRNEVVAECSLIGSSNMNFCQTETQSITVSTDVSTLENERLAFQYSVSAGKVVGNGSNVVWDLSGVKPGVYTISIAVDDECGVCGQPVVREIKVIECQQCKPQ